MGSWSLAAAGQRAGIAVAALTLSALAAAAGFASHTAPVPGHEAPQFSGVDSNGKAVSLADFKGQRVILEWTNHECPYVRKHYETENMQALQKEAVEDGYVWISVISSAPGQQGHVTAERANALSAERSAAPDHVVMDAEGVIGRLYDARTTPHMFIIDGDTDQTVLYAGAIDDKPTARKSSVSEAKNFVRQAMAEIAGGKPVSEAATVPYGCSVKYAS